MANRWGNSGNTGWLYFSGLQIHCRWWLKPWNWKMLTPWKESPVPGPHKECNIIFIINFRLLLVFTISQTYLIFDNLDKLKITWYFVKCSSSGNCLIIIIKLCSSVFERKTREVVYSFHPIISKIHTINIAYHSWCWPSSSCWGCQVSLL